MQYLKTGHYPVYAPPELFVNWNGKLPACLWSEVLELHKTKSLRSLAREYGVPLEAMRRTISRALDLQSGYQDARSTDTLILLFLQ